MRSPGRTRPKKPSARTESLLLLCLPTLLGVGCMGGPDDDPGAAPRRDLELESSQHALTTEDGLADAFASFKQDFVAFGFDQQFRIGYGFHPGLSTEKTPNPQGHTPRGTATLVFAENRVIATLDDAPLNGSFDLYFVKNVAGSNRTVAPESGDTILKVGTFAGTNSSHKTLNAVIGATNIKFDLDLVVVTRKGQQPTASRVAVGARTLFEKRFFRERNGKTLDPVSGTVVKNVETNDQLVARGAQVFFNEKFNGNGRTCGTCHRAERSLTIDPPFIAGLPQSDPLFVAETNPALAELENPTLMRQRGLIRENVDGLDDPTHKFVMRGVPHTLAMNQTVGIDAAFNSFPFSPPDHRVGWGGDGAPGRSTLHEFGFGAVIQHFTKTLTRKPGVDFRIPTQEELDALEAFQLFSGRQKAVNIFTLAFREPRAESGRTLFFGQGSCTVCHSDLFGGRSNGNFNTGVAALTPDLPVDDGFLDLSITQNSGTFNIPPLVEAADTVPLFHNNAAADVEAAVAFYASDVFAHAPNGFQINLNPSQQADIGAFLRVLNAAENMRQVRKRVLFVRNNRSTGNTDILTFAIADSQDILNVLSAKSLSPAVQNEMADVKNTLVIAKANADANRVGFMDHALAVLDLAKNEIFSSNPDGQF